MEKPGAAASGSEELDLGCHGGAGLPEERASSDSPMQGMGAAMEKAGAPASPPQVRGSPVLPLEKAGTLASTVAASRCTQVRPPPGSPLEKGGSIEKPGAPASMVAGVRCTHVRAPPGTPLEKGGSIEKAETHVSPGSPLEQSITKAPSGSSGCGSGRRPRVRSFREWLDREEERQQRDTKRLQEMYPDYQPGTYLDSEEEADFDFLLNGDSMADVAPPVDTLPQQTIPPPHQIIEPAKVCSEREVAKVDRVCAEADGTGDGWLTVRKVHGARADVTGTVG